MTQKKSFCRNCTGSCGLVFEVEDNNIISVRGDAEHPITNGYHCIKAPSSVDLLRKARSRLLQSMKRGDAGGFSPINVELAMDEIAEKIRKLTDQYGPRSVGLYYGTGAYFNGLDWPIMKSFISELGSPNLFSTMTIDQSARWVSILRQGTIASGTPAPMDVDTLMVIGKNPIVSHQLMGVFRPGKTLSDFRKRGGKLIVVDPRKTETVRHADSHLALRPGSDAVLFAGMLRLILKRGWHDAAFCEKHCVGLEELEASVDPFTAHRVYTQTGIRPEQLEQCSELFSQSPRSLAVVGTGPCMGPHSNLAVHLVDSLNLICGNFLRGGESKRVRSLLFPRPYREMAVPPNRTWEQGVQCHSVATGTLFGELPTGALPDEILTPGTDQIRALIVLGGNPATALGQPDKTLAALDKLELLVTIDPRMTETAELSDYVIAPALQYERHDLTTVVDGGSGFSEAFVQYTEPVVEAPSGVIFERDFFWGLAKRLDLQLIYKKMILGMDYKAIPHGNLLDMASPPEAEQLLRWWCEGAEVTYDQLCNHPEGVLASADSAPHVDSAPPAYNAAVSLCPPDVAAELAVVGEIQTEKSAAIDYPFRLIVRRLLETMNSLYVDAEHSRRRYPVNYTWMSQQDMEHLGIDSGDTLALRSPHGEVSGVAKLDKSLPPGVVAMAHQWAWGSKESSKDKLFGFTGGLVSLRAEHVESINRMPQQTAIPVQIELSGGDPCK